MGLLWTDLPVSRAFFYVFLGYLNKQGLLRKTKSHLYLAVQGKERPLHVPTTGPL